METYKVLEPILLRATPSADGKIVSGLDKGKTIDIISEENGWLKTISGRYVLDSNRLRKIANKEQIESIKKRINKLNLNLHGGEARQNVDDIDSSIVGMDVYVDKKDKDLNNKTIDASAKSDSGNFKVVAYTEDYVVISDGKDNRYELNYEDVIDKKASKDKKDGAGTLAATQKAKILNEMDFKQTLKDIKESRSLSDYAKELSDFVSNLNRMTIHNTRAVFGMPYQWLPIADTRIDNTMNNPSFGRKYIQKIVARSPILVMQAGVATFLHGYNSKQQDQIKKALLAGISSNDVNESEVGRLLNNSGRYYNFKAMPTDYFRAVNQMCRTVAAILNLDDEVVNVNGNEDKLGSFNWELAAQHPFAGYNKGSIGFYLNSETQVQEGFSNGTRQSRLASTANQVGDLAEEVNFLLGGAAGKIAGVDMNERAKLDQGSSSDGMMGLLSSFTHNMHTMMAGGRMYFPEIWADSSFMRNYDVTIRLDSPDCDTLSIYLNIFVPLCHILGLCMPRSAGDNTYVSPFLVRAFYKSFFHVDMGIITNCSIQRGDIQAWTQDGLPTQITVQLSIKDLYDVMAMATGKGDNDMIGNPAQLDYLANMCGVNIAEPNMLRYIKLYWITRMGKNAIKDNIVSFWSKAMGSVYRTWNNLGGNQSGNGSIM